ncbi:MAG: hypothetical protein K0R06_3078, partial [Clostridium sp.]|nr:hypothetical protein [Clostridium sp.]
QLNKKVMPIPVDKDIGYFYAIHR